MDEESWKRNHGNGGIIKEKLWRRNHVGFIRGGTIEEESSESHLGAIWKASGVTGQPLEAKCAKAAAFLSGSYASDRFA